MRRFLYRLLGRLGLLRRPAVARGLTREEHQMLRELIVSKKSGGDIM